MSITRMKVTNLADYKADKQAERIADKIAAMFNDDYDDALDYLDKIEAMFEETCERR